MDRGLVMTAKYSLYARAGRLMKSRKYGSLLPVSLFDHEKGEEELACHRAFV